MIKKYPWHFVYLIFVIISLANIFQKLKWTSPTDKIHWERTEMGLMCVDAPKDSAIKEGDILLTVSKYVITDKLDLNRVIRQKKYHRYEIERSGIIKNVGVDIVNKSTPFYYYILVFSGLLFIILTLNILNADLKQEKHFSPPPVFFLVSLSFSGFLIFSPTGSYNLTDFSFLFLDRLSFILFPAFLLQYAIYFPIKSGILKRVRPRFLNLLIYVVPVTILVLYFYFIFINLLHAVPDILILTINYFRNISLKYFVLYLFLALTFFFISNLTLIVKKQRRIFLLPFLGTVIGTLPLLVLTFIFPLLKRESPPLFKLSLFLLVFLPLSLAYYLRRRKFTDIENIIKKTISISSIFLFIFGIYFFLGFNVEKNRLLGIFWSIAAIITAGLLYKPIESTVHNYFEQFFFKGTYNFKRKLKELIQSLREERDLSALSRNFLETINHGFNLSNASLIIHYKKNIFYSYPEKNKLFLSKNFRNDLFLKDNMIFFSTGEFAKKYPKDYQIMETSNYFQFLPLKTQEKLTGLVAFGLKKDKTYLSIEDWELMFSIASSLSLSVENASLYTELENQIYETNLLKEFNESIIENLNLGVVVLSKLNIIRTWNYFMEFKFKIPRHKALNKKAHAILGTDLWKKIHDKKESGFFMNHTELEIHENEFIFDIYTSPLKDNAGKIIGTIIVFEDVTEKIRIQNQLLTSEKMASVGMLSAGIAHEINTPLTGISSYCQLLLDNPVDADHKEMVLKMQEQVQRANKIIRTLLDFSRQKGEPPVEQDLNKLINESLALVEHQLKKKKIRVRKEYHFKNKLFGFSTRLQQLFINLLINSSDAVKKPEGIITIQGIENKENITVKIADNGTGIDQKNISNIFDPFFTTKDPGDGTGLGLSISYNIIKEHYGDIKVNSKKNQGTTFTITFPLQNPLRRMRI